MVAPSERRRRRAARILAALQGGGLPALRVGDIAQALGVSERRVRGWLRSGKLRGSKLPVASKPNTPLREWRITPDDLESWLETWVPDRDVARSVGQTHLVAMRAAESRKRLLRTERSTLGSYKEHEVCRPTEKLPGEEGSYQPGSYLRESPSARPTTALPGDVGSGRPDPDHEGGNARPAGPGPESSTGPHAGGLRGGGAGLAESGGAGPGSEAGGGGLAGDRGAPQQGGGGQSPRHPLPQTSNQGNPEDGGRPPGNPAPGLPGRNTLLGVDRERGGAGVPGEQAGGPLPGGGGGTAPRRYLRAPGKAYEVEDLGEEEVVAGEARLRVEEAGAVAAELGPVPVMKKGKGGGSRYWELAKRPAGPPKPEPGEGEADMRATRVLRSVEEWEGGYDPWEGEGG